MTTPDDLIAQAEQLTGTQGAAVIAAYATRQSGARDIRRDANISIAANETDAAQIAWLGYAQRGLEALGPNPNTDLVEAFNDALLATIAAEHLHETHATYLAGPWSTGQSVT